MFVGRCKNLKFVEKYMWDCLMWEKRCILYSCYANISHRHGS